MTAEIQKRVSAELLAYSDVEFDIKIKEMSLKDLLETISTLQKEMSKEQENFNSLKAELASLNKNSCQYKQISKEMRLSQARLTALMDRSMKCFQQQGNQSTLTKFPNVQRRGSLKETKPEQQVGKPVQRNQSARIPKGGGEITQPVIVNKSDTKSTPDLVTSSNQPVFLKSLTNVTTSKIDLKRSVDQCDGKPSVIKPVHKFQNGCHSVNNGTFYDEKKNPTVKSSAAFNLQKSRSHEFLANRSSKETDMNKNCVETKKPTGFNVVLRKTNRNLIDNEEQENNFRHSVDLDFRESPKIPISNREVNNATTTTKATETAAKTQIVSNVTVSSSLQPKLVNGTGEGKTTSGAVQTHNGDFIVQKVQQKTEIVKPRIEKHFQKLQQKDTTKPVEAPTQKVAPRLVVKDTNKAVEKPLQKVVTAPTKLKSVELQNTVKPSIQFKPVTAVEARAVASGGDRQNLLQEIQNFKRKPNPDAEKELCSGSQTNENKIIKSSIKPNTDVANDLDLSPEEAKGDTVDDDEVSPHRINLINWDPTKLLNVLYTVKLNKDTTEDVSHQFVNMEGLMEKLPMNKKKATLLKTWKRRFFRAKDGWLHYYEGLSEDEQTNNRDKPSDSVQLMGGKIEDLGNRVLGVDDGRGRFLMVRCPTEKEYGQWKMALESQTVNNIKATYVRPALSSPPHPEKKVILIDIGSGGIRAGIMGAQPCLPQMYFPSLVARNKATQELVIGIDAFKPEVRKNSTLIRIVEPSNKVEKDHFRPFAIDMELILAVFNYIFKGLKVDAAKYWVMLSTPYKLGDTAMNNLMQILVDTYHTKGVCMVMQSLLALYSYNATSGIIVDIGERMEILPIFDGVLIEGGVSRQAYGGQKVRDSLNSSLVELKYKFNNPVDKLIIRYVMEQSCYVCDNYKDLKSKCDKDSESFQTTVYLNNFDLPDDAHMSVSHDLSCFKSPEGFFNTDLWGMDYPCVHKLVHSAIQSCPMDNRKHMYRAIYLSGGLTMLPGFAERLENELKKLAPPGVVVEVHASPQRYHSAFIGAGTLLSNVPINEQVFISAEEWRKDGAKAFRKWKGPS